MIYDVIIIGAGPAGLTAALYALRDDARVLLLEKESIGGNIASSPKIENYPGFSSISGPDFVDRLFAQATDLGAELAIEEATAIKPGKIIEVKTTDGVYSAKSVIIATGTKYKRLGFENEERYIGRGVSYCTVCDGAFYKNAPVAVIGGGNTALIDALDMTKLCPRVYLFNKGDSLSGEAKRIKEVLTHPKIETHNHAEISELIGDGKDLTAIKVRENDKINVYSVKGIFVAIGHYPDASFVRDLLSLTEKGEIIASADGETNVPGVFVAGDCREKNVRQLATAVGDGAIAALSALRYLKG